MAAAHDLAVPIYTSSPGDSSIGMNVAEQALAGSQLRFDVSADVNETSALGFDAKVRGGKSGVLLIGGGGPQKLGLPREAQSPERPGGRGEGDAHLPQKKGPPPPPPRGCG